MYRLFFIAKNNLKKKKSDVAVLTFLTMLAVTLLYVSIAAMTNTGKVLDRVYEETNGADQVFITASREKENLTELISGQIPSGSVTREKLAKDALYSPIEKVEATTTLDGSSIGKTIRTTSSSTDYVINVKKDSTIPIGSEIAILRDHAKTCRIIFGSDARAGIVGMSSWITACTLSIEENFSMIALKKIVSETNYDYWVVTGNVEVLE